MPIEGLSEAERKAPKGYEYVANFSDIKEDDYIKVAVSLNTKRGGLRFKWEGLVLETGKVPNTAVLFIRIISMDENATIKSDMGTMYIFKKNPPPRPGLGQL